MRSSHGRQTIVTSEDDSKLKPVVAIVGPTGSGKSELSLVLAARFSGEIVNCDSIQLYSGLDIGSAKLSVSERRGIPHHLLDVRLPTEELSAGEYARLGREVIRAIHDRQRLPIIVGGTGLYLRALLDGLSPAGHDQVIRNRLRNQYLAKAAVLHRYLRRYDPVAAVRIHPNDTQKLLRAVELTKIQQKPATVTQMAPRDHFTGIRTLRIGLLPDRAQLHERLNARSAHLFQIGLVEEVQRLLANGIPADAKPLQSLGYQQAVEYIRGHLSLSDAIALCATRTRQYAKRQITWFRNQENITWLPGFGSDSAIHQLAIGLVIRFLGKS